MVSNSKAIAWEPLPSGGGTDELGADRALDNWRPLRYFNMYRATLSGLIITLAFFGIAPRYFGQADSDLFWITAVAYFAFSVVCSLSIQLRWGSFQLQVVAQVFGDIVAITLMMHASGGVVSGFGTLLVVAIAGGSILTEGRIAILFAAIASLAVLFQQIYAWLFHPFSGTTYSQAGMLGITFFATAFLAYVLAKRVRASEALATKRGIDLANLAQLNEHIIQRMQSGVLVLDEDGRVRLLNGSARQLLALSANLAGEPLARVSPELLELEEKWRGDEEHTSQMFQPLNSPVDVMASFSRLGRDGSRGSLIYLEDASAMRQRAQQLKLASLGRLTASIAHEIRNPLGAISHAGQLLGESPKLVENEKRLTEIIDENCHRMNAIVENILQLSRRKDAVREQVDLAAWLVTFVDDFKIHKNVNESRVRLEQTSADDASVRIDASQLHQIVWNLCENGLRHAGDPPELVIRTGIRPGTRRPYVEVQDNGEGVPKGIADNLFEPFFTTQATGTGLGLYIARELCEINQASLNLVEGAPGGGCFRITFSDQRRQGVPES